MVCGKASQRNSSAVLELFQCAIQRKQFKSVTYSDEAKVHFDLTIRFADLAGVNLSPTSLLSQTLSYSLSPSASLSLFLSCPSTFPLAFYYCSCQSCTFKVPITRAGSAEHPFPPYISRRRSLGRSYGFFYFRKWRPESR